MANEVAERFTHVKFELKLPELPDTTTEAGRFYTAPDGSEYPSITTMLKYVDKEGLDQWRKRVGEKEAKKQTAKGANRGTGVHEIAENYLNNKELYSKGYSATHKYLFNTIKKHLDNDVDNIVAQEVPLYSHYLKLAGRVDLIADYKNKASIIDFKTAKREKKPEWIETYWMQATFYSLAFEEHTGIKVTNLVLIFSHDDGTSKVFTENRKNWVKPLMENNKLYRELAIENIRKHMA